MKKNKKLLTGIAALSMCAVMGLAFAGCGSVPQYTGEEGQGVKVEDGVITFTIGNTAATTGAFASVGVPFNYGLEAWLWAYSVAHPGIKFDFKHYDDTFDGAKGLQFTQQLVETDKVFALVGHFGTNTIEATVDYITETGVPMVYAATGVNSLYNAEASGYERAIMSVQPIYKTEGRSLLATAVAPSENKIGLGGQKVGVIYTTDDAGKSILEGIEEEAQSLGVSIKTQAVDASASDYSAAVNALKSNGCDVAIIASAQVAFAKIATQFVGSNYDNVSILTSYVSANADTMGGLAESGVMTETRKVYAGAWLDIKDTEGAYGFSAEYWAFAGLMSTYGSQVMGWSVTPDEDGNIEAAKYGANSYAMAGYVAGATFTAGIDRLIADKDLSTLTEEDFTWVKYVEAMESAPVTIPMTKLNAIDLSNGQRLGVTSLSLLQFTPGEGLSGEPIRPLTGLAVIEKAYNDAK